MTFLLLIYYQFTLYTWISDLQKIKLKFPFPLHSDVINLFLPSKITLKGSCYLLTLNSVQVQTAFLQSNCTSKHHKGTKKIWLACCNDKNPYRCKRTCDQRNTAAKLGLHCNVFSKNNNNNKRFHNELFKNRNKIGATHLIIRHTCVEKLQYVRLNHHSFLIFNRPTKCLALCWALGINA